MSILQEQQQRQRYRCQPQWCTKKSLQRMSGPYSDCRSQRGDRVELSSYCFSTLAGRVPTAQQHSTTAKKKHQLACRLRDASCMLAISATPSAEPMMIDLSSLLVHEADTFGSCTSLLCDSAISLDRSKLRAYQKQVLCLCCTLACLRLGAAKCAFICLEDS